MKKIKTQLEALAAMADGAPLREGLDNTWWIDNSGAEFPVQVLRRVAESLIRRGLIVKGRKRKTFVMNLRMRAILQMTQEELLNPKRPIL